MSHLIGIIQARTGSTRLPRKVLRDLGGRPVLAWVVAAARESLVCDEVIVATTTEPDDDAVVALAGELGARVVRGPVDDVLTRFLLAADAVGATSGDAIVRLTADCPLLDPLVIAKCAAAFAPGRVDYVTTDHSNAGHEGTVAHGLDVEIVDVDVLRRLDELATGADRAHVTSYVTADPDEFHIVHVGLEPSSADLRITLDEPADAELLEAIVAELGTDASDWRAVVALLRARPDLVALNAHVTVKPLAAG
jgi:spore coat polysaccharide biosynthesis protein SpsF